MTEPTQAAPRFRTFQLRNLEDLPGIDRLSPDQVRTIRVVGSVLPFKTNSYVCEQLVDWDAVPDDPMYQLTFPQRGMLEEAHFDRMAALVDADAGREEVQELARSIQRSLNPHPAGQVEMNVPWLDGHPLRGMQHKYRETVLFFPSQGQTCHAYCTYCFRWPQFVALNDLKFASKEADELVAYLRRHPGVTDVIFTGGDPLIMRTELLERCIEPLLAPDLAHVNIRIGTKAPAYWPYRFLTDDDADDLLRLFERVVDAGRHLAVMAHYSHPRELSTTPAVEAVRRINTTGAVVRAQAPLIRHVNDDAATWVEMLQAQIRVGVVPYYLFVERDTGAKGYFEVPLARAFEIYSEAYRQVSGLARTWRGPSMSATPGKVLVRDITEINGERVFALDLVQGRNPEWSNRLFFARFDPAATWWDDLEPAFGERQFFFSEELARMREAALHRRRSVDHGPRPTAGLPRADRRREPAQLALDIRTRRGVQELGDT